MNKKGKLCMYIYKMKFSRSMIRRYRDIGKTVRKFSMQKDLNNDFYLYQKTISERFRNGASKKTSNEERRKNLR